jgi:hypothetical protein
VTRGRLIFPVLAELYQLDSAATARGPLRDGAGFDADFREPVLVDRDGDGLAEPYRIEGGPILVPAQVEVMALQEVKMTGAGDAPASKVALVMHFRDLTRMGLVDPFTGASRIGVGTRLGALRDPRGRLIQAFPDRPGLFATESKPMSFGLGPHPTRNLLLVTFEDRPQARSY